MPRSGVFLTDGDFELKNIRSSHGVKGANFISIIKEQFFGGFSEVRIQDHAYFNLVNLETGEIIENSSSLPLPKWVEDPLSRAIKVAEFHESMRD